MKEITKNGWAVIGTKPDFEHFFVAVPDKKSAEAREYFPKTEVIVPCQIIYSLPE